MRIVRLTLTGPPGSKPDQTDAEMVHDVLWTHSHIGGIAHITATAMPQGIDVTIFLDINIDDPERHVAALIRTVSRESAILRRWAWEGNC